MKKSVTRNVLVVFGGVTCCVGPRGNGVMWMKKRFTRSIPRSSTSGKQDGRQVAVGQRDAFHKYIRWQSALRDAGRMTR